LEARRWSREEEEERRCSREEEEERRCSSSERSSLRVSQSPEEKKTLNTSVPLYIYDEELTILEEDLDK
jgi:hypothetical protein